MVVARANGVHTFGFGGLLQVPLLGSWWLQVHRLWEGLGRQPRPRPTMAHCSNSCPLSWWCYLTSDPVLLFSLSFSLSQHQGLFQRVSSLHQVAKDWSFSSSISLLNKYSGWISFRIDWFYLLALQRTLKSLLKHHSLKALILKGSALFTVQLSHPYMTDYRKPSSVLLLILSGVKSAASVCRAGHCELWFLLPCGCYWSFALLSYA